MSGVDAARSEGERLAERAREVRRRVADAAARSGRDGTAVLLVAVTKNLPVETMRLAYAQGLRVFGENRVLEAREKHAALGLADVRWELIGQLQSNKIARAIELFDRVQSVASVALAQALDTRAARAGRTLPVLLEVNVAGEASKSGFAPTEVIEAARAIAVLPNLRPEGLMTIAPMADQAERARPVFRELRRLRASLRAAVPLGPEGGWHELSMGMSDDFEVAIEEGATIVRIGQALFGARPTP